MSVIHAPNKSDPTARMWVFPVALFGSLTIIFLRLWYYQVVSTDELTEQANVSREDEIPKLAPRGLIYDRQGKLLAGIQSKYVLTGVPSILNKDNQPLLKVAQWMNADPALLQKRLSEGRYKPYLPTVLAVGVPVEVASRVAEDQADLPGIAVEQQPMRTYGDTTSLSHVLGYVGKPSKRDIERLENDVDDIPVYVGKDGIERQYDLDLMGTAGSEKVEVDAKRRPLRLAGRDAAQPGQKLYLSLDMELQKVALQALSGRRGAVVALDPTNGEVLCMVSSPTFDTTLFLNGIKQEELNALSDELNGKPLFNRAMRGAYAPGSTFKIVTSIAAAKKGIWDPNHAFYCPGYVEVGNRKVKCLGFHSSITYENAFTKSCNAYFGQLGLKVGADTLRQTALDLGFYAKTGIDLPGEGRGVVPTDEFIQRKNKRRKFFQGDLVNLSIGQGELAVTPLQMASLVSLVANEGVCYRPHLLRATQEAGTSQTQKQPPEVLHKIDLTPDFWAGLKRAMVDVVDHGTATRARIEGIAWGGKTGTAEFWSRPAKGMPKVLKTHSWYVGVAPMDQPKIAIAVVAEESGHGGDVAAPIASNVVRTYLKSIAPKPAVGQPTTQPSESNR